MSDNYINFVAVEELFNSEKESIQDDNSLDYSSKRMLVNELDRVWHYILQIPIRKIVPADAQSTEQGKWEVSHKHIWKKKEDGSIDTFAYSEDIHNGVVCEKCGDFFCIHCDPNYDEEICERPHYICSDCGESSREATPYCPNCGAKMIKHGDKYENDI